MLPGNPKLRARSITHDPLKFGFCAALTNKLSSKMVAAAFVIVRLIVFLLGLEAKVLPKTSAT
jgi:hypothetical protein